MTAGVAKRAAGSSGISRQAGGKIYTPLGSWYHALKHALEGWSDCLRLELAPLGIDVIVIEPGLIETGFGDVVSEGLLRRSGDGAYARMTKAVAAATRDTLWPWDAARKPSVIADVVGKAVGRAPAARTPPASWPGR